MANEYVDEGIPFLRSQDIQPFGIVDNGSKFITPEFHAKLKKSELRAGDVAIVRTGFPGTAAVVPQRLDRSNCADLVIATPGPELNPWFLACLMNSAWGKGTVSGVLVGVAQQHFNVGAAKEMRFRCPPIAVQDRIADILSAYDDLIENNTRRIAILEDMARRLFEEWFVRSPEQPSWPEVAFTDIASVGSGGTPKKDNPTFWGGDIAFFTPRDAWQPLFAMDTLAKITGAGLAKCNSKLYPTFTVFITARGTVGNVLLAPEPMAMNQSCYALSGLNGVPQSFLFFATRHMADELRAKSSGAVFDAIIVDTFRAHSVKRPPLDLMQAYDRQCLPMLEGILVLRRANANLRSTRDLLLPKLISGEIEVRAAEEALEAAAA